MRLPNRKPGKYTFTQFDPQLTPAKLAELKKQLAQAKQKLPQAIREVQQYGENGDFSENAEYQVAKARLRGLNRRIDELTYQINHAELIAPPVDTHTVQTGHTVTVRVNGQEKTFTILGSSETNPAAGVISYHSPVGAALLGKRVGEHATVTTNNRTVQYEVLAIE